MTSNITKRALEDKTYIELKADASKKAGYEMSYTEVSKKESEEMSAKQDIMIAKQEAAIEQMQAILRKHGIKMAVGGCGCCGSPWVDFEYKGKRILDGEDDAGFDMFEDDDGIILLND